MCGICGILNFDTTDEVMPGLLEAMTDRIAHRGPDDFGYFAEGPVGLGHRRLSIIDISGGRQPMGNEDGSVVTVFNGELYNHRDLAADLVARGHRFQTRSDTETIVHAYEEFGDDCVTRFRGMFAFAVWDRRKQRLLLARDRLGIKPLYYYQSREGLVFASEIKSLLECPDVPRELDETSLDLFLSLRYVPGPRTMFQRIHKLQPGHLLMADRNGVTLRRYWDLPPYVEAASGSTVEEEFEHLLEESVRMHLMSDVPLGVFLSGGLDSSAMLAMTTKVRGGYPIRTFSVGYDAGDDSDENNEFVYAREAASRFGAEHHEVRITADDFSGFIPRLVWHLDEPLADPSCVPLYFIARRAREHITVVLSGEGADEILGGYAIYPKMLGLETLRRIPGAGAAAGWLGKHLPEGRYQNALRLAGLPLEMRYRGVCRGFSPGLQARLMGQGDLSRSNLEAIFMPYFETTADATPLSRMLHADAKVWLPDDLLLKADKMTMAAGLELRVPFLDHRIVEFAAQLADSQKYNGRHGKALLRRIMTGVLPDSILHRPKKGFPVPMLSWMRGPLQSLTRDTLLAGDSACRNHFDPQVLTEIVDAHQTGADRQQELWTLMIFEFWHQTFLGPRRAIPAARFCTIPGASYHNRARRSELTGVARAS